MPRQGATTRAVGTREVTTREVGTREVTTPTRVPGPLLAAVVLVLAGCAEDGREPRALCWAADEVADTARDLAEVPPDDLDAIAADYRRLAEAYRDAADELDDRAARHHARDLAATVAEAARDLDAVDDFAVTHPGDVDSPALAKMHETINANLPLGLDSTAMQQIEVECDPSLDGLPGPELR